MAKLLQYCTQAPIWIIAMEKFLHTLYDLYWIWSIIQITITKSF
jgi:hypothetical protein